ncbi:MAG: AMP-binding protein [Deinococcales bacterium]
MLPPRLCQCQKYHHRLGLRDDEVVIQATPCFHAAVNAFSVPLLHLGASIVMMRQFEPEAYLRLIKEHQVSILFLIPTMYKMLSDNPSFAVTSFESVRWAISGGAPCPAPVRDAFAAKGVRFKQGYGLTEAGVNCFAMELDDASLHPHSIGKPIIYSEAALLDTKGQKVSQGEMGELCLKGDHLFSGYFKHPKASQEILHDGWLWTGDLAKQDEDGFYYIAGRRKEMYISGGENIFPVEIEKVLYEHQAISECAVLGVPDAKWGEVGLAAIVLKYGFSLDSDSLKYFLKQRIAGYKVPKHYRFLKELPKSGAGKILKVALAEAFAKEMASD